MQLANSSKHHTPHLELVLLLQCLPLLLLELRIQLPVQVCHLPVKRQRVLPHHQRRSDRVLQDRQRRVHLHH